MATPSPPAPAEERSAPVAAAFSRGGRVLLEQPWLALLPLVETLIAVEKLRRSATADVAFQLTFGLPTYVASLWTFVNAPTPDGVTVFGLPPGAALDSPGALLPGVVGLLGGTLLVGLLAAPYLGTIDRVLTGRTPAPATDLRRYAPVTVGFAALEVVGFLLFGLVAVLLGATPLLIALALGGLVVLYLLGPVPFVGIAADLSFGEALGRGVDLATTGRYLAFALAHALVAAVCSPVVSALAFAGGLSTVLLAAFLAAPLGLALNAATMAFVHGALGQSGPGAPRDDGPGGPAGGDQRTHQQSAEPTPAIQRVEDGEN